MDYHMRWRHVVTCCRVMCAYYAYVTIRRALGVACFGSRHFVNTVSGQHFSAENKQAAAEFDSQHLPMHFRGVIWKIKSKSNFPVSFSLINAEMNLVGNYRTLRGLRTVNPEGLPSTGPGPTRLRARARNRDRLENRSHVVPKTEFQDGGGRTRTFTHKITILA